ncbi:Uncharacterized protein APZ42_002372 [Daphnia magna]|uniref:Uncharacterized protein n=1 Tax=Daphnia magna TaxID=35525 RepID=A0A164IB35_9CRUS|nr:Uncharacterized protein APZ42_002372 [Daphnia magna]
MAYFELRIGRRSRRRARCRPGRRRNFQSRRIPRRHRPPRRFQRLPAAGFARPAFAPLQPAREPLVPDRNLRRSFHLGTLGHSREPRPPRRRRPDRNRLPRRRSPALLPD